MNSRTVQPVARYVYSNNRCLCWGQLGAEGRVRHQITALSTGYFVPPTVIRLPGIGAMACGTFGSVLHLATFLAANLNRVIDAFNVPFAHQHRRQPTGAIGRSGWRRRADLVTFGGPLALTDPSGIAAVV